MEPDTTRNTGESPREVFNPRAPCGARPTSKRPTLARRFFNPRAPCGARQARVWSDRGLKDFQSTGSVWSPTPPLKKADIVFYFSIHGLRVEPDPALVCRRVKNGRFSIHGLRVEPDIMPKCSNSKVKDFSIHGLRVEPDEGQSCKRLRIGDFQSTGSVWSPTPPALFQKVRCVFQSTGSVWSPTRMTPTASAFFSFFNPRAPCGARRLAQSRHRRRRGLFNPRAPCGARPPPKAKPAVIGVFQSTGSVWSPTRFGRCPH